MARQQLGYIAHINILFKFLIEGGRGEGSAQRASVRGSPVLVGMPVRNGDGPVGGSVRAGGTRCRGISVSRGEAGPRPAVRVEKAGIRDFEGWVDHGGCPL